MKYRNRTEVVASILQAAMGGATKTKIMYRAFLSFAQLKEYLLILEENGLLHYNKEESKFMTTNKGMKFLRIYEQLDNLVNVPPKSMEET
ncbi:MAG TPA: winged helix-turn-helix domain-containing protein [Nitrososphaera sp.]|jgi:predicted transcriptional regulator